jgi:hypothetical protein
MALPTTVGSTWIRADQLEESDDWTQPPWRHLLKHGYARPARLLISACPLSVTASVITGASRSTDGRFRGIGRGPTPKSATHYPQKGWSAGRDRRWRECLLANRPRLFRPPWWAIATICGKSQSCGMASTLNTSSGKSVSRRPPQPGTSSPRCCTRALGA